MDLVADLRPQSCPVSSVVGTKRYQQQLLVSAAIASEIWGEERALETVVACQEEPRVRSSGETLARPLVEYPPKRQLIKARAQTALPGLSPATPPSAPVATAPLLNAAAAGACGKAERHQRGPLTGLGVL
ncbi:hypothetical protein EYF80_002033 [Liparis tanakae]|uniref:Uncharacterized protein n=1 Tax=Liparis tanakae TaxID=230148 RepID=A0A4Z2JBV3_9TELE|nr:hypothetical protein EYF80_002033 [Liparis tanakae]